MSFRCASRRKTSTPPRFHRCLAASRPIRIGKSCEEAFDEFVRSLPDAPAAWERIAAECEAQVYVCVWMRTSNRDYDISVFALGELARRRLRLHIDTCLESDDEDSDAA